MPDVLWGDMQWGDVFWGEDDLIAIGDFADTAGNELALPAPVEFLGFADSSVAPVLRNRIYDMHIKILRELDATNGLFWKRFCEGPEVLRRQFEDRINDLPSLYSVSDIEARYVKLLLPQVGWGADLSSIIDKLDNDTARRLVSLAVSSWKRRAAGGSSIEILNTIIGVDAWEWDWFDRRFVLGKSQIGHDQSPQLGVNDLYVTGSASSRTTELHIADAERSLDRELVREIVKLWRPIGERVRLVYVEFWDRFANDSKPWETYGGASSIAGGKLQMLDDSQSQHAFPESPALLDLSNFMVNSRLKFGGENGFYGQTLGFRGLLAKALEIRLYPEFQELRLYQDNVQIGDSISLIHAHGITLKPGYWRTLRSVVSGATLEVFIDNHKVLSNSDDLVSPGTSGVNHSAGLTLECDSFEIIPIPGEVDFVDINS